MAPVATLESQMAVKNDEGALSLTGLPLGGKIVVPCASIPSLLALDSACTRLLVVTPSTSSSTEALQLFDVVRFARDEVSTDCSAYCSLG